MRTLWVRSGRWRCAGRALRLLRGRTIGVVGQHPAGFDTCAVHDVADLAWLFGVDVAALELPALLQAAREAPEAGRQADT